MREFTFGPYRLMADIEATRAWYGAHPLPWVTCDCGGCRNFVQAVKALPPRRDGLLHRPGPGPGETGGGLRGPGGPGELPVRRLVSPGGGADGGRAAPRPSLRSALAPAEGVEIAFGPECHLLPEDFPRPCVQLNLEWRLPWLLEEKNPYFTPEV